MSTFADNSESIQYDVVFLLDSSDAIQDKYGSMLEFVERMIKKLNVDENKDHVSVVQYSREPSVEFFLNTYKTQQNILAALQQMRQKGGKALNTGTTLQYIKDNVFTPSSGSRQKQGVPQILILITGGPSSDDVRNAVESLKGIGVIAFVVGTKNANATEIQFISQKSSRAFLSVDFNDLSEIEQQIFSAVREIGYVSGTITPGSNGKTEMSQL